MQRRELLKAMSALALFPAITGAQTNSINESSSPLLISPLKEAAAKSGRLFGSAVSPSVLRDTAFAALVNRECSIIVPENQLKMRTTHPALDRFNFSEGDWLLDWAGQHGIAMRGHTLVWHQSIPDWLARETDLALVTAAFENYLLTTTKHFSGKLHSWDVVNESVENGKMTRDDGLRVNDPWLRWFGPDYIEQAFRLARQGDPKTPLFYNEYGIEFDDHASQLKREATLELLASLKRRGVPVDGLGIQAHLGTDRMNSFSGKGLRALLDGAQRLKLKVLITELDCRDDVVASDLALRDAAVASSYRRYMKIAWAHPAVSGLLTWGLSDRYSWLVHRSSSDRKRQDNQPYRPLPFDEKLQPKLAVAALVDVMTNTTSNTKLPVTSKE